MTAPGKRQDPYHLETDQRPVPQLPDRWIAGIAIHRQPGNGPKGHPQHWRPVPGLYRNRGCPRAHLGLSLEALENRLSRRQGAIDIRIRVGEGGKARLKLGWSQVNALL